MPKGMRATQAPALDNALLRALIAELPSPKKDGFPQPAREAWITMARHAFDVVYGVADIAVMARAVGDAIECHVGATTIASVSNGTIGPPHPPGPVGGEYIDHDGRVQRWGANASYADPRFYVDHDGFAMRDGVPLAFEDLPAGVTLWDERSGIEAGDAMAILWKDVGTVKVGLSGIRLVPAVFPAAEPLVHWKGE